MSTPPIIPLPMFATTGWTTSMNQKADGLLGHFFASDSLQSNLYSGNISNIQAIIQQYGTDIIGCVNAIRQQLDKYLRRFYPAGVQVSVTSPGTDPTYPDSEVTINISATVTENNGNTFSFGYAVSQANSIVTNIARLNNYGAAS
jgi:hypothetical protein